MEYFCGAHRSRRFMGYFGLPLSEGLTASIYGGCYLVVVSGESWLMALTLGLGHATHHTPVACANWVACLMLEYLIILMDILILMNGRNTSCKFIVILFNGQNTSCKSILISTFVLHTDTLVNLVGFIFN